MSASSNEHQSEDDEFDAQTQEAKRRRQEEELGNQELRPNAHSMSDSDQEPDNTNMPQPNWSEKEEGDPYDDNFGGIEDPEMQAALQEGYLETLTEGEQGPDQEQNHEQEPQQEEEQEGEQEQEQTRNPRELRPPKPRMGLVEKGLIEMYRMQIRWPTVTSKDGLPMALQSGIEVEVSPGLGVSTVRKAKIRMVGKAWRREYHEQDHNGGDKYEEDGDGQEELTDYFDNHYPDINPQAEVAFSRDFARGQVTSAHEATRITFGDGWERVKLDLS